MGEEASAVRVEGIAAGSDVSREVMIEALMVVSVKLCSVRRKRNGLGKWGRRGTRSVRSVVNFLTAPDAAVTGNIVEV